MILGEASCKVFLNLDKAREYADTFKCKTKTNLVAVIE